MDAAGSSRSASCAASTLPRARSAPPARRSLGSSPRGFAGPHPRVDSAGRPWRGRCAVGRARSRGRSRSSPGFEASWAEAPDVVVVPNDAAFPYDRIAAAAARRGLPLVLVQEGIRFPLPVETGQDAYGLGGADVLAAWGEASADYFRQRGVPGERIVVTGNPRFAETRPGSPKPAPRTWPPGTAPPAGDESDRRPGLLLHAGETRALRPIPHGRRAIGRRRRPDAPRALAPAGVRERLRGGPLPPSLGRPSPPSQRRGAQPGPRREHGGSDRGLDRRPGGPGRGQAAGSARDPGLGARLRLRARRGGGRHLLGR